MREFYLLNGNGAKFDLMSSHGFFHAPTGLGFDKTQTYLRTGDFYKPIESYISQKMVTGEMIFKNYEDYHTFASFIASNPLKLVYKPLDVEYRLDCTISNFGKTEIDHTNNRLICPITFMGESRWYYLRSALSAHPGGGDAKKYTYSYNYTYYDALTGVIDIINDSPNEAPCILYIRGYCLNPSWVLSVNNEQVSSGGITGEILDGNQIIVNSRDDSLEIAEYTAQNVFVQNLYQDADITRENFLYLPPGTSKLTITDDSMSDITAYLEILEEYDTV
jgi:hypothetical protein